jgi:hypothetical protein
VVTVSEFRELPPGHPDAVEPLAREKAGIPFWHATKGDALHIVATQPHGATTVDATVQRVEEPGTERRVVYAETTIGVWIRWFVFDAPQGFNVVDHETRLADEEQWAASDQFDYYRVILDPDESGVANGICRMDIRVRGVDWPSVEELGGDDGV